MSNSIYEECTNVIANSLTDDLLFYFQENREYIEDWRESFLDATAHLINTIADEIILHEEEENMRYLIIKCTPLSDQYETDCDRVPIGMTHNWKLYQNSYPYIEVWELKENGYFELIKNWDN
jgi:hypothetical protein